MPRLPVSVRRLGGKAVGARGSGKTLYAAWQTVEDFKRGVGSICLDPMGSFSTYVLSRLIAAGRPDYWKKVIYVPVGGVAIGDDVFVIPTPFLYNRTGHDALQDMTARPIAMWKRLSPQQENAPIQGMPSIERTANYAGMLLAAMGNQLVPDAASLIREPHRWEARIRGALTEHPVELAQPARYFLEIYTSPKLREPDRLTQTLSFSNKIDPYVLNPRLAAQYGANAWGVDIRLVEHGYLILFDFHTLPDEEHRTGTTWLFTRCMEYFRSRGPRRDVVGFVVDELSYLADRENRLLEKDFEDLVARLGRNYGISPFFTYQEVTQPSLRLQQILDMAGYSLFAGSADPEAALRLTHLLDDYRPHWVKDSYTMYAPDSLGSAYDQVRDIYFSPQEQEVMNAAKYRKIPGLTFKLTMAYAEGEAA